MKNIRTQTVLATALSCAMASVAAAQTENATLTTSADATPALAPANPDADAWQFGATLPLWAPQIDGNVTAMGHQQDVNISFNTLWEHLDTSLGLALSAQKGKFGLSTSVGYMKFSDGNANFSAGLKFLMYNADASYLLVKTDGKHPFVLAGTAGIRYWYASDWLTIPAASFHGSKTRNVLDPVIGLRGSQYLTRKLHLDFSGDIGGFDISHDTDFTWSAAGMVTYDFTKWFSASAGYSAVALDESQGSGANKNGVDLIFHGVAANLTLKF